MSPSRVAPQPVAPQSLAPGYRMDSPWKQRVLPTAMNRDGVSPTPRIHGHNIGHTQGDVTSMSQGPLAVGQQPSLAPQSSQRGHRSYVPHSPSPQRNAPRSPARRQFLDAVTLSPSSRRRHHASPGRKSPSTPSHTSMPTPLLMPHGLAGQQQTSQSAAIMGSACPDGFRNLGSMHTLDVSAPQPQRQTSSLTPEPAVAGTETEPQVQTTFATHQEMSDTRNDEELAPGVRIGIGNRMCTITSTLGMGSFGVVWAADCDGVGEVAVKEILCQSQVDLARALYEAELIQSLSNPVQGTPGTPTETPSLDIRIPEYVGSEVTHVSPEVCRMRLAMAKLPGEPLDRFLRTRQKEAEAAQHLPVLPRVVEACRFARELVLQLAPTMERISALAYHRDVNAHNILVTVTEGADGPEPQYGLVDFGLAVNATRWQGGPAPKSAVNPQGWLPGSAEWQHLDVGGDCRYWPTSAWLQFEVGCYELAEAKALCLEYQTHLDLQGLGITALQVLAEMMPNAPCENHGDLEALNTTSEGLPLEMWRVQLAWENYWAASTHFWSALLDTFRNNGDWNVLKNEFIAMNVHEIIARKLRSLRTTLTEAREACRRAPVSSGLGEATHLFSALLVLVSAGEEREGPTSWEKVVNSMRSAPARSRSRSSAEHRRSHAPQSPKTSHQHGNTWSSYQPQVCKDRSREVAVTQAATGSASGHRKPSPRHDQRPSSPTPSGQHHVLLPPPKQVCAVEGVARGPHASWPAHTEPEAEKLVELAADLRTTAAAIRQADTRPASDSQGSSDVKSELEVRRTRKNEVEPGARGYRQKHHKDSEKRTAHTPPHELFVKLNVLANKVVQLAHAMEKLELQDRSIPVAADRAYTKETPSPAVVSTGYS